VWKEGPYAEEGVECQDCHMTSGITKFEANPGRAGSGAQKREHISTHAIVGGNAFITEILGEEKYKEMAVERLKKTANLSIDAPQIGQRGDNLSLNISITNSGAGHKIPTGVSEIRQMWLAVSVKDGDAIGIHRFLKLAKVIVKGLVCGGIGINTAVRPAQQVGEGLAPFRGVLVGGVQLDLPDADIGHAGAVGFHRVFVPHRKTRGARDTSQGSVLVIDFSTCPVYTSDAAAEYNTLHLLGSRDIL